MFPTAFTHNLTQFARTLSFPERLEKTPFRNLSLEPLRQRNTTLDSLFYDVKTVTPEEAFYISDSLAAEGAILLVPPSGGAPLKLYDTLDEFILDGGLEIDILAVAGVGSSALGSAAFARNIADAAGRSAAVVVSGYGLADVVTEALGGHFLFGYLNNIRHSFEILDEFSGRPKFGAAPYLSGERLTGSSLDTQTVRAMLGDPRLSFRLLTGHSKGNLVLSEALYDLQKTDRPAAEKLARQAKIVTFSARIAMPPLFSDVIDVMGEWDWFGEINSRAFIANDEVIPQAWHHTNTDLPNHLPVTAVLREILARMAAADRKKTVEPAPPEQAVSIEERAGAVQPSAAEETPEEPPPATPAMNSTARRPVSTLHRTSRQNRRTRSKPS
ncbi:hypothetical protein J2046_003608 [Rhizobium petrolearium]|uniref:hypothetical protein n=1 Tax=Neorhizobium petrolearium TaxID=515361 RepID=UPI001AEA494D|nr:hypothetical protein [Neorhizobium petrolearium]MBP1845335.1 hypothetical protein [Neorhizobium petrolearium]